MARESEYSRTTDIEDEYLSVTDVKQYMFCPMVTYFTRVMRLRPIVGSQQEEARKVHEKIADLEGRRQSLLKSRFPFDISAKQFDRLLISDRLGTLGRVDMLVITTSGERIPVEFKAMRSNRGQVHLDHKYQIAVLAILVEEVDNTIVRRGIVHYLDDETSVIVNISHSLKKRTEKMISSIWRMVESGTVPPHRRQCSRGKAGCGFADQCQTS
ncbi:MAG: CRISPR-associated protein Cas4 [Candidatus Thorarchaeota archaeon]